MWSGSSPSIDAICGLRLLLGFSIAPSGVSPGTPVFPSSKDQHFQIPVQRGMVNGEPLCGCATSKSLFVLFILDL